MPSFDANTTAWPRAAGVPLSAPIDNQLREGSDKAVTNEQNTNNVMMHATRHVICPSLAA
jgi:hypothetical protein